VVLSIAVVFKIAVVKVAPEVRQNRFNYSATGTVANCVQARVQPTAPGSFSSGLLFGDFPYAAAVNQDGSINSAQNPAAAGSVVSLYVTGLGAMTPSPPDGSLMLCRRRH
jgi:uncharacterized protein (TIGR03437 family)